MLKLDPPPLRLWVQVTGVVTSNDSITWTEDDLIVSLSGEDTPAGGLLEYLGLIMIAIR